MTDAARPATCIGCGSEFAPVPGSLPSASSGLCPTCRFLLTVPHLLREVTGTALEAASPDAVSPRLVRMRAMQAAVARAGSDVMGLMTDLPPGLGEDTRFALAEAAGALSSARALLGRDAAWTSAAVAGLRRVERTGPPVLDVAVVAPLTPGSLLPPGPSA